MGNICSSTDIKSKRSNNDAAKKKKCKAANPAAKPKGGKVKSAPVTGKKSATPAEQPTVNPLGLTEGDGKPSGIVDSKHVQRVRAESLAGRSGEVSGKLSPKPPQAKLKDVEQLSDAKLGLIRGWIDIIDKTALLDPQDVIGQQRRLSRSESNSSSSRQTSILTFASIDKKEEPVNGSMAVEHKSRSSDDPNGISGSLISNKVVPRCVGPVK